MFNKDFVWGAATSSLQIEGRDSKDGASKNVWDTFVESGHIFENHNMDVACDHIHRFRDDVKMMKELGIKAYRFSVSWARLIPTGVGEVNPEGVKFYRELLTCLKENDITPFMTLYHWETPQCIEDRGGWRNPDIVKWFGNFAKVVAENFSDLCEYYFTVNEPQCFIGLGYQSGYHAPGQQLSVSEGLSAAHNMLKSHGQAVINLRKYSVRPVKIGYAPTAGVACPASDSIRDIEAARKQYFSLSDADGRWFWNVSWFSDPVIFGKYPEEGLKKFAKYLPEITKEDMELISQPIDFLGQNIYNGYTVKANENGEPEFVNRKPGYDKTCIDWPITPEALYWGPKFLYERYHLPIYITENGMSCHDAVSLDGKVHDPNRIDFLNKYLSCYQKAADDGVDIAGYFQWSLMDNFEWTKGYSERFGIVYVDFVTQERIPKDSAYWYRDTIKENGANLAINTMPEKISLYR